jgi:two-component system nitrate/nitrite response regulator NarL
VIAQVDTLAGLHGAIQRFPTDMILLEGNLIAGTVDAIPELVRRAPQLKIIVQSAQNDETNTVELYRRGVRGIIPRSISPDLLVKCVRKIAAGETWIDNQSINWVIEAYRSQASALTSPRTQPRLSPKELAIITCITQGKRNKEIAYQLGTTEQVIKNYLRKVYDKLGVSDRLELALYCLHHQLHKKAAGTLTVPATGASPAWDGLCQRRRRSSPPENSAISWHLSMLPVSPLAAAAATFIRPADPGVLLAGPIFAPGGWSGPGSSPWHKLGKLRLATFRERDHVRSRSTALIRPA